MDYHQNARLTVFNREQLARKVLEEVWTLKQAAACFNVSAKKAGKWVWRYKEEGSEGLKGPQYAAYTKSRSGKLRTLTYCSSSR